MFLSRFNGRPIKFLSSPKVRDAILKLKLRYSQTIVGMRQYLNVNSCRFFHLNLFPQLVLGINSHDNSNEFDKVPILFSGRYQHNTKLLSSIYGKYSIILINDYILLENNKVIKVSFSTRTVISVWPILLTTTFICLLFGYLI